MNKIIVCFALAVVLAAGVNVYAADGDMVVNGKLGVGTTNPITKLHIKSSGNDIVPYAGTVAVFQRSESTSASVISILGGGTSGKSAIYLGDEADEDVGQISYDHIKNEMRFNTNASQKVVINSSGNVGIGTTNPQSKLQVHGPTLDLYNSTQYAGNLLILSTDSYTRGNAGGSIGFGGKYTDNDYYTWASIQGHKLNGDFGNADGFMAFYTRGGGVGTAERMRISSAGNVGIGTTNPLKKLHVNGEVLIGDADVGDARKLKLYGSGSQLAVISNGDSANADIWFQENSINKARIAWVGADEFLMFGDAIFAKSGNVGIGTTNPVGKLDVNGSIYIRGGLLHADYVFAPEYKLESIEEHAKFMWGNRHLKAISKAQVDENGLEVVEIGARNKGVVEELEKAHIYIEQLNERIKALENKIASLEK